jgi:hypothetical protein
MTKRIVNVNYWGIAKKAVIALAIIAGLALVFKARMLFIFVEFFGAIALLGIVALALWEMTHEAKGNTEAPADENLPTIPVELKTTKKKVILRRTDLE